MKVLAAIGVLAILVAVGAAVFFFGGFYSVAASQEEPALVAAALIKVRQASIAHHAVETPPPNPRTCAQISDSSNSRGVRGAT